MKGLPFYLSDDVALEYYRNEKTFEGSISLNETGGEYLTPGQHGSAGGREEEKERLSSIIERMNDRFGTEFTQTDKLSRDQIVEDMMANQDFAQKAQSNTKDNFKFSFNRTFMDFVVNRMQNNEEFFMKILEDAEFKEFLMEDMIDEVYDGLRDQNSAN